MTTPGTARPRRLRRAEDLMDRDRAEPLDLAAVAAHAGYARDPFFPTRFRERAGRSPGACRVRHVRRGAAPIPECCAMLRTGGFEERDSGEAG